MSMKVILIYIPTLGNVKGTVKELLMVAKNNGNHVTHRVKKGCGKNEGSVFVLFIPRNRVAVQEWLRKNYSTTLKVQHN